MDFEQFKKQRSELVSKLVLLAIEINEQGKYYANCNVTGHVNWINLSIYLLEYKNGKFSRLNEKMIAYVHAYTSINHPLKGSYKDLIVELEYAYSRMLEFLEV